jgi:hypothetical protein
MQRCEREKEKGKEKEKEKESEREKGTSRGWGGMFVECVVSSVLWQTRCMHSLQQVTK